MTTHSARLQLAISQAFKEMNEMTEEEFRQTIEAAQDDPRFLTILYALDFSINTHKATLLDEDELSTGEG